MKRRSEPLYSIIARELREEIIHGEYQNEERLPSEAALYKKMGVSRTTIREAVGILEQEGLVN